MQLSIYNKIIDNLQEEHDNIVKDFLDFYKTRKITTLYRAKVLQKSKKLQSKINHVIKIFKEDLLNRKIRLYRTSFEELGEDSTRRMRMKKNISWIEKEIDWVYNNLLIPVNDFVNTFGQQIGYLSSKRYKMYADAKERKIKEEEEALKLKDQVLRLEKMKKRVEKDFSAKSRKSRKSGKCKEYLNKKIAINISEYKMGKYKSPAQAVAVAYSQVRKKHPSCRRVIKKSKKSSRKQSRKLKGGNRHEELIRKANVIVRKIKEYVDYISNENLFSTGDVSADCQNIKKLKKYVKNLKDKEIHNLLEIYDVLVEENVINEETYRQRLGVLGEYNAIFENAIRGYDMMIKRLRKTGLC
jgi:hypothetical protein